MGIQRVESVVYGVEDMAESKRFFTDFGLTLVSERPEEIVLEAQSGGSIVLRPIDDPTLPASVEEGPGIREIVWGVDTQEALEAIVARVAVDREVVERDGAHHFFDETGWGTALTIARPKAIEHPIRRYNRTGRVERVNEPQTHIEQVRPFRVCHVALNIPKEGREEAWRFYTERLGFVATDIVEKMGIFLRAPQDEDQHTFLLCHRPDKAGTNHTSYEVAGFDDVIEGVNAMVEKGWRESRRLGRHTIGSNVFRFVQAPCGGRVELAADMDRVDETYGPNYYEDTPPHHIYTLAMNRDQADEGVNG